MKRAMAIGTAALWLAPVALAAEAHGPVARAYGLQTASNDVTRAQAFMHNTVLMPIITAVVVFVFGLLLYVMVRFRRSAHPNPKKFSHNTLVEIIWTTIPVAILIFISLFSFPVLFQEGITPKNVGYTVKVRGNQWNWTYVYPDESGNLANGFDFTSVVIPDNQIDAAKGQRRLLSVDYPLVVPAGENIKVLVTAADVIHSFGVQSLGFKMDAVPGKVNETWFKADKPGIYYGVCYELCGVRHGFMPIEIHAVPRADFDRWLAAARHDVDAGLKVLAEADRRTPASVVRLASTK